MKHIILSIILLSVTAFCLSSQSPGLSGFIHNAGDNAALYYGRIEQNIVTSAWDGQPYWDDADYHLGEVCYDGVIYPSVMLRYNVMTNEVIVLTPERQISVVPNKEKIDYFTIDSKRFQPFDGRFAAVEADGPYRLMHTRVKKQGRDKIVDRKVIPTIYTTDIYYLLDPEGKTTKVSSLKHLCKACPEYAEAMKALKKSLGLQFSDATKAQDLAQCVSLVNSHYPTAVTEPAAHVQTRHNFSQESSEYENIPDSILTPISIPESLLAYRIYSVDDAPRHEYADDDTCSATPGISALNPSREAVVLNEVEVIAIKSKSATKHTGMESFRPASLRNVPMAMGENDVLKLALMLPGVTSTGEASSGLNVRGGGSDQNLTLYNGNTVFNPTHMFGLFSVFNSDMISETELFKGSLSSEYGGRLSSVMNNNGRIASKEKFGGSASIGLVTSKAMLELPLVKHRASLLLGGRTTYSDWMLTKLSESSGYKNGKAGFWDLSGTLSCSVGESGSLQASGYYSRDRFSFTDFDKYGYSNLNASAEYRTRIGSRTGLRLSAGYDHYDYFNDNLEYEFAEARLSFALNQAFLRTSATYRIDDNHLLKAGAQSQYYFIMPGKYEPIAQFSHIIERKLPDDKAVESALYAEDNWQIDNRWSMVGGVRLNVFDSMRPGLGKVYINPDLRMSATCKIADGKTLKLGFNTQHQYIHKVSNTVIMSPTDTWMLSNAKVRPQHGWQLSGGYFWQSPNRVYEISAEVYYKGIRDYLTYRSGAQLVMNPNLENDVVATQGRAYGLELQLTKTSGKLNGWVSYTYSRTELRQTKSDIGVLINNGAWFPSDFDSPHVFKFVGNYKFTRRYSTSVNVDYSTGRPYTAPVSQYYDHTQDLVVPLYSDRNQVRMPNYFRVDWSFNIEPSHHLTNLTHSWLTIGVYNVLGRKNAYSIYFQYDREKIQGYMLSIFGAPIPYISYNIRF